MSERPEPEITRCYYRNNHRRILLIHDQDEMGDFWEVNWITSRRFTEHNKIFKDHEKALLFYLTKKREI